jgi:hypothetical protein
MSYSAAHPRPSVSGRRLSRVHFDDQGTQATGVNQASLPPREDPYSPRWQNSIYDGGTDSGRAPVDDYHRPSAATLVNQDPEPPLDHLGDFMNKKAGNTSFSSDKSLPGVRPPPETYAPGRTSSVMSKKKKESRTMLERWRRASISTSQVKREETPEELVSRLEKEKRRGLPVNHRELYGLPDPKKARNEDEEEEQEDTAPPIPKRPRPEHATSEEFDVDVLLDERDPRFTGRIALDAVLDRDEIELERLKKMTFAQRMSEKEKDKIRFHIVCKWLSLL